MCLIGYNVVLTGAVVCRLKLCTSVNVSDNYLRGFLSKFIHLLDARAGVYEGKRGTLKVLVKVKCKTIFTFYCSVMFLRFLVFPIFCIILYD